MAKANQIGNTLIIEINGDVYTNTTLTRKEQLEILLTVAKLTPEEEKLNGEAVKAIVDRIKIKEEKIEELKQESGFADKTSKEEVKQIKSLLDGIDDNVFELIDGSLYMKKIPISIPTYIAKRISEANGKVKNSLLNFWRLCALNQDPNSREQLLKFLENYKFPITESGLFVAYRYLVKLNTKPTIDVTQFVDNAKKWKRAVHYFTILSAKQDGKVEYFAVDTKKSKVESKINLLTKQGYTNITEVGNLKELMNQESEEEVFTDNHTKTFRIKMNDIVSIDRNKCDSNPNSACSYGLHVGTPSFLNSNRGSFGNVAFAVLVNPMDVVSVPKHDQTKMRVCKYKPFAYCDFDSNNMLKTIDLNTNLAEHDYMQSIKSEFDKLIETANFVELEKKKVFPKELTIEAAKEFSLLYEKIVTQVQSRVVKL